MRSPRTAVAFALLGWVALAALVAGCSAEGTPAPPLDPSAGPATPDLLVQDFQTIYESMSASRYARLLDPAFVMPLQARTAADYPDLGPAIELAEALRIHQRLFLQQEVTDPDQQPVRAVQTIAFPAFMKQGEWTAAAPGSAYPGTVNALYEIIMVVDRGSAPSTLKVQGALQFHVVQRDTVVNGASAAYCRLQAITDLTYDTKLAAGEAGKATETVSLGRLWGLWR